MTAVQTVLDVARRELGTQESPVNSNNVKYNTWYYGRAVRGDAYPWCAVFVSWVSQQAGATGIIPKHAYTPSGAQWFKDRGQWGKTPRVGAIVYYQWPGMSRISHVGIVEAVHSDGSWTAIEGNTDGSGSRTGGIVMRQRRRSVGSLGGFGYPAYSGAAPAPAPAAPAPSAPSRNVEEVKATQRAVNFTGADVDGKWGDGTDGRVNLVREALNGRFPQGIAATQVVVGTKPDNAWGPNSRRALTETVTELQNAWGVDNRTGPGTWGPRTEAGWAAARARNYKKY